MSFPQASERRILYEAARFFAALRLTAACLARKLLYSSAPDTSPGFAQPPLRRRIDQRCYFKWTLFSGDIDLLRTHTCGELRLEHVGQQVTLCGWVDTYRDHSGVLFIDLRDRYGKTQVVFAPEGGDETLQAAKSLRSEFVVLVRGKVAPRPEGTVNPKLLTGQIELRAEHLEILNRSLTPPFQPTGKELPGEDLRLKHRYVDLRRPEMQRTLLLRQPHDQDHARLLRRLGFHRRRDADARPQHAGGRPRLPGAQPRSAGDVLRPAAVAAAYKQILMVAGFDRYIQVARCFRDEDLRADRQPEFTQLDLEMSFITADDIMGVIEGLVARLAKEILGLDVPLPLPRMTYDEAMERFGHDAPDLRFGMEIVDISDLAKEAEFMVFRGVADAGGRVRGINAKGAADRYSRKGIDELTAFVVENFGAKGLAWFKVDADGQLASPIAKNFSPELLAKIGEPHGRRARRLAAAGGRQVRGHLQSALCLAEAVGRPN